VYYYHYQEEEETETDSENAEYWWREINIPTTVLGRPIIGVSQNRTSLLLFRASLSKILRDSVSETETDVVCTQRVFFSSGS